MYLLSINYINSIKTFALTTDTAIIEQNRALLEIPSDNILNELLNTQYPSVIFPFGRYIIVLFLETANTKSKMYFFDYSKDLSKAELQLLTQNQLSDAQINQWFDIQYRLATTYTPADDIAELVRV